MEPELESELEKALLPAYTIVRSILYSDYGRKNSHYTKTQIAVLAALTWKEELCMSQIAEYLSSPRAQMTRAIDPLVEDGLIERFEDKNNRKMVYIRLTATGKTYIRDYLHTRFGALRDKLTPEEAGALHESLKTIIEILKTVQSR